jgi:hypothetical protein
MYKLPVMQMSVIAAGSGHRNCVPIYHPCAKNMRRPKRMNSVAVPPHRYGVYGVDLSRYVWNICSALANAFSSASYVSSTLRSIWAANAPGCPCITYPSIFCRLRRHSRERGIGLWGVHICGWCLFRADVVCVVRVCGYRGVDRERVDGRGKEARLLRRRVKKSQLRVARLC